MSRKETPKSYSFTLAQEPDSLRLAVWYIVYRAMSREELDKLLKGERATARLKDDQRDKEDFDWLYLLDDEPYYEGELEEEDEARATKVVGPRMPGGVIGRIYRFWKKRHSKGRFQEYFPVNISKKIEKIYKEIEDARKKLDDAEDEEALHPTPKAVTTDPRTDEWFKELLEALSGVVYSKEQRNELFNQMVQITDKDKRREFIDHLTQDYELLSKRITVLINRTAITPLAESTKILRTALEELETNEAKAKGGDYDFSLGSTDTVEVVAMQILGKLKFYGTGPKGTAVELSPEEERNIALEAARSVEAHARSTGKSVDEILQTMIYKLKSQGAMERTPDDPFTGQVKHKLRSVTEVAEGKNLREYIRARVFTLSGTNGYIVNQMTLENCLKHFKDGKEYTFADIESWLTQCGINAYLTIPDMYEAEMQYRAK